MATTPVQLALSKAGAVISNNELRHSQWEQVPPHYLQDYVCNQVQPCLRGERRNILGTSGEDPLSDGLLAVVLRLAVLAELVK